MARRASRTDGVDRSPRTTETAARPPFPHKGLVTAAIILVAVTALVVVLVVQGDGAPKDRDTGETGPTDEGPVVRIPLSEIGEEARWFEYPVGGVTIRFFVALDGDGDLHAGLDACEVCYSAKKGFHQEEGMMQCNSCGNLAPIAGVGRNSGDCWPGPVPSRLEGDEVLLSVQALQDGVYMFI